MKKLLFITLIALITFSCRTVKQTSQIHTDVKTSANLDIKQSNESKKSIDSTVVSVDKGTTTTLTNEQITITQLSKPDSTGRQYTTVMTVINRITDNKKVGDLKTQSKISSTTDNKTILSDKSDIKSDLSLTQKNKVTEEIKTPGWVYIAVIVLSGILLLVVYLILKRFNILK